MEWIKISDDENMPTEDIQCLVVMKKSGYIDVLSWCSHYASWDDFSGDDHFCDKNDVIFYIPFSNLPCIPNLEDN